MKTDIIEINIELDETRNVTHVSTRKIKRTITLRNNNEVAQVFPRRRLVIKDLGTNFVVVPRIRLSPKWIKQAQEM